MMRTLSGKMEIKKIIKTGNSLAVTIPSHFAHHVGIKAGDNVEVEVRAEEGKLVYTFSGNRQLTFRVNL